MKFIFLFLAIICINHSVYAQDYPEPEFSNEVSFLKRAVSVVRLEKNTVKMESKTRLGGLGGAESGYTLEGEKSGVVITAGNNLSFVYAKGASSGNITAEKDSMMRANGMDPSIIGTSMNTPMSDPANMITLYKAQPGKGKRKITLQKMAGASPFASRKVSSSDKYTFSAKKIREGYWVLVVDKNLPTGSYAFAINAMGMGAMDGEITLFSFEVQ
jgi:hypothetical protein